MGKTPVTVCVCAQDGPLVSAVSRLAGANAGAGAGVVLEHRGTDLSDLLVICAESGAVLLLEPDILDREPDLHRHSPSLTETPALLVYETVDTGLMRRALSAGIRGLVDRAALGDRLHTAAHRVLNGGVYLDSPAIEQLLNAGVGGRLAERRDLEARFDLLSAREQEIFLGLARGVSTQTLARELGISAKTVETHQSHIYRKLGAGSAVDLFHIALRLGLTDQADTG